MVDMNVENAISESADVAKYLDSMFKGIEDHEEVWVMFLNNANIPTGISCINIGDIDSSVVDKRRIVKQALNCNATGVILFHNHISGDVMPSSSDIRQTASLKSACDVFDIRLVDHIIVGKGKYYSFEEQQIKYPNINT